MKMKKVIFIIPLIAVVLFFSCQKDDDNIPAISTSSVTNTITSGTWRITYYWDTDHDETANYNGYNFTFGSGNVLTATKAGTSVTGTWTTLSDDSKTKLVIAFSAPDLFVEISDDWHVFERTDTRVKLQDVSGGGSGTDLLTFEKN